MAKGDPLYARLEIDFIRSFKFQKLPPGARLLYLSLWCYALEQRRQIIERPDDNYLANLAGLKHHPITSYLETIHDLGLASVNHGYIDMIGLIEKHKQFTWKTPPFDFDCAQMPPQEPNRTELNRTEPKKKGKKKPPPTPNQPVESESQYIEKINDYFTSITDGQVEKWTTVYLGVPIGIEIKKAHNWLVENPNKRKKKFGAFLANWFSRSHDRIGDREAKNNKPDEPLGRGSGRASGKQRPAAEMFGPTEGE